MTVLTGERRSCVRVPAAYTVRLFSRRGAFLGRGRVADISQNGAYMLAGIHRALQRDDLLEAELTLPALAADQHPHAVRQVRYLCRVAHANDLGDLWGIGIELLKKLR